MDPNDPATPEPALETAAAVTMVKGDLFFLQRWIDHYGRHLGRKNLYIVNHGRGEAVARAAEGCNVIGIPEGPIEQFDAIRWTFLNNLVGALRGYYAQVIVGDVDELLVVDPACGQDLGGWLAAQPRGQVMTALGLEVLHLPDEETGGVEDGILGARRYVRISKVYSKPCIVSTQTRIARGGHFASYPKLVLPDELFIFHLKYADFDAYVDTLEARNRYADQSALDFRKTMIGRHWFSKFREDDAAVFRAFAQMPLAADFDTSTCRARMRESFGPRGESGFFHFDRTEDGLRYRLPERFFGLF